MLVYEHVRLSGSEGRGVDKLEALSPMLPAQQKSKEEHVLD